AGVLDAERLVDAAGAIRGVDAERVDALPRRLPDAGARARPESAVVGANGFEVAAAARVEARRARAGAVVGLNQTPGAVEERVGAAVAQSDHRGSALAERGAVGPGVTAEATRLAEFAVPDNADRVHGRGGPVDAAAVARPGDAFDAAAVASVRQRERARPVGRGRIADEARDGAAAPRAVRPAVSDDPGAKVALALGTASEHGPAEDSGAIVERVAEHPDAVAGRSPESAKVRVRVGADAGRQSGSLAENSTHRHGVAVVRGRRHGLHGRHARRPGDRRPGELQQVPPARPLGARGLAGAVRRVGELVLNRGQGPGPPYEWRMVAGKPDRQRPAAVLRAAMRAARRAEGFETVCRGTFGSFFRFVRASVLTWPFPTFLGSWGFFGCFAMCTPCSGVSTLLARVATDYITDVTARQRPPDTTFSADETDLALDPRRPVDRRLQHLQELVADSPVRGRRPEIHALARVLLEVVKLADTFAAGVPRDLVAGRRERAQRHVEGALVVVLGDDVIASSDRQRASFQPPRKRYLGGLQDRRRDVDEPDRLITRTAGLECTAAHHQRDAQQLVVVNRAGEELPVLAEHRAMVAGEDDERLTR